MIVIDANEVGAWVNTMPAESCTEIGANQYDDYDDAAPEGFAIAVAFVAAVVMGAAAITLAAAFA